MAILTETITLNPNQSKDVAFVVTPADPGYYTVKVDGLEGGFMVQETLQPSVVIGGLTVRLMCDNVGVCVQEVSEPLTQGILLIAPATRQFLAERNYEVWVYPELYDPKTEEYQDPTGMIIGGRSYSDRCTIHGYNFIRDRIVIHELGHALDRKLGWISGFYSSGISDYEAIVSQEQCYGPRILEDWTYGGVIEVWANEFQSVFLQRSGLADFCVTCPPGCDYIRQVAENPWSYL